MKLTRYFLPRVNATLIVFFGIGLTLLGLDYTIAKHAQRAASERLCQVEVDAIKARNVWARKAVCPADPCRCRELVRR